MENASKALIMAGEVLLGVLVISLAVFLFRNLGTYSAEMENENEIKLIGEFNEQFTKYEGGTVTAHNVITVANLAKDNNKKYELTIQKAPTNNSFFIRVDAPGVYNMEGKSEAYYMEFLKNNTEKTFTCEVRFGKNTKRVNYVIFK